MAEFGLTDAREKLDTLLKIWAKQIRTTIVKNRMTVEIIKTDLDEVLQTGAATQLTDKNEHLPWLNWLLVQGDKTIIRDFQLRFTRNAQSRTGLALMIKVKRGKWGVPSQFAGTPTSQKGLGMRNRSKLYW